MKNEAKVVGLVILARAKLNAISKKTFPQTAIVGVSKHN